MNNNDVFEFGTNPNEEASNFNYEGLSGLGESNYENEDLFDNIPPVENKTASDEINNVSNNDFNNWYMNNYDYNLTSDNNLSMPTYETPSIDTPMGVVNTGEVISENSTNIPNYTSELQDISNNQELRPIEEVTENIEPELKSIEEISEPMQTEETIVDEPVINPIEPQLSNETVQPEQTTEEVTMLNKQPVEEVPSMQTIETIPELNSNDQVSEPIEDLTTVTEESPFDIYDENQEQNMMPEMKTVETPTVQDVTETEETPEIEMSETPIEDLQKLTEYEDEKIETTDINSLFDALSVNVKDASEIFIKNTNLKQKIDSRFEELKGLQGELENSRKKQMEEIDKYRDEVLDKLTEKKSEIEKRLNVLKELQATLEKEKTEFEEYKRKEQANISKVQKEVQSAYDERREELEHIEDVLRKQKDALDEERNQLSLDKIQYEADKNDLANNLLKFNQIVNSFTNGIEMDKGE